MSDTITNRNVYVIIPAYNEEKSIAKVILDVPKNLVEQIIVGNNNSKDNTALEAKNAGAIVVDAPISGYGNACLKGIDYLKDKAKADDIIVFMDGDYSDYPEEIVKIIAPIQNNQADLVIGSRALGIKERGAMTLPQEFGNWLATRLIKLFYGVKFTDLGPFRAITWGNLMTINMQDKTYGWTVEMQIKAAKLGLRCVEVPVTYRKRIGVSKVSGTLKGVILAGYKIIWMIFKNL
ncbi:glycosyltransferase family 2 protein [Pedobacter cryophilus]|uniref:Glycosyltransferase family 2 protein n=1 Tax=Pedobacter cryophilus TaxID=2571271 RepID=A0A4U1BWR7_9SPHI|nr:glycosyltransferase family 2 protein [Pedobacter cryophilus]TKB95550.1 glycosyltransferase family 2 protein [Pedobacter cryophilus]